MKIKIKIIAGMVGLASLFMVSTSNAMTVTATPSASLLGLGDPLALTIGGIDFTGGVSSAAITVSWDTSVLQLDSTLPQILATVNPSLTTLAGGDLATPGQLNLAMGDFGPGVAGPTLDFFSLNFSVIGTPVADPSNILLSHYVGGGAFRDGAGTDITGGVGFNNATVSVSAVPIPAAVWLLGSGLLGLVGVARRRSTAAAVAA